MKVIITPHAQGQIGHQLDYGIQRFGKRTAQRTFVRIDRFLTGFLSDYPLAGRRIAQTDLHECWIPRTPFVVIYRIEQTTDILRVLGFFHGSQSRSDFTPDDE